MKNFNSFDKSIQFTIDRFEDGIVHYPDIKINGSETDLYYNTTHKQYNKCQFQFFLRKNFKRTKTKIKPKPTNKTKASKQKTLKATIFRAEKLLRG